MPDGSIGKGSSSLHWIRSSDVLSLFRPECASHFVQFYADDVFLIENVAYLTSKALEIGESSVLIATPAHLSAFEKQLAKHGVDFDASRATGRYVPLDAAQTLAGFLVDGAPDPLKFEDTVGAMVREAGKSSDNGFIFAFGEMVTLLCADGRPRGAIRLEQMWNALARKCRFSLYCAYPLSIFDSKPDVSLLLQICAEHSLAIPAETLF
jgi:hypothetical protein